VRFVLCTAGGFLLILAVAVDLVWTTLGTHGGPAHRVLSFVGSCWRSPSSSGWDCCGSAASSVFSAAIIGRSWTGENFDGLDLFMSQLTTMLHTVTEQHFACPVLHYFHSEQLRTAAVVRMASLFELTLILAEGVARPVRPSPMTLEPLRDALTGTAQVIESEFVAPAAVAPPPPPLAPIRDLGIPTVADAEFAIAVRETDEVRRLLLGLVEGDGWSWSDVNRR
jgi:hypothetical protein